MGGGSLRKVNYRGSEQSFPGSVVKSQWMEAQYRWVDFLEVGRTRCGRVREVFFGGEGLWCVVRFLWGKNARS